MPISELDGCSENHWRDVKTILIDAIKTAGFDADLVSEADDVGIIQKRIIQNIYENPIVVCDVSGKNSNVMFELGMRLAFDKPTIIVKDDRTNYSFDTSIIEHLTYPRDLRYSKIVEFKEKLASKIISTYEKSTSDPSYTTFLKNFGEFTSPKLDTKEVSKEEFILEEIKQLKKEIAFYGRRQIEVFDRVETSHSNEDGIGSLIIEILKNYKSLYKESNANELKNAIYNDISLCNMAKKMGISKTYLKRIIDISIDCFYENDDENSNGSI